MKIIGLTGGIASGKSTVSTYLRLKGIPVFDADAKARESQAKGGACLGDIVKLLGPKALSANGDMDRKWVSQQVFQHPEQLDALNALVHTYVTRERDKFISQNSQEKLVVLDAPLLIECTWHKIADYVWLVAVDKETQIARAMTRSSLSLGEVEARIAHQMSLEDKKAYAQVVLENSGSKEALFQQVDAALNRLDRELR